MTSKTDKMEHRAVLSSKDEVPLDMRFLLTIAKSENTKTPITNDGETNLIRVKVDILITPKISADPERLIMHNRVLIPV